MGERVWGELELEEGYGNSLELKFTTEVTNDELASIINQLDEDRRRELIYAIVGCSERAIDLLKDMGSDDREQVLGEFCVGCKEYDPHHQCNCMRDD